MRGVNKAIILGHLGQDPETRYLPSGGVVTNISVATSEQWKDKNTGEKQEKTEWHRVVFFGRIAEVAAEYLKKGAKVYVEGKLSTNKWQDKNGVDRWTTQIVAHELQMLGGKGGSRQESDAPKPQGDFDDDIPFAHAWAVPMVGLLLMGLEVASRVS